MAQLHLAHLYIYIGTQHLVLDGIAESGELLVATDDLEHIAWEQDVITIGDVYTTASTQDTTNVHTILGTQLELCQRLSHPSGVERHREIGNMDIAIEQLALVERTFLAMHLGLDIARTQVLDKQALECDATVLGTA